MKYTEGICGDGATILCNGEPISITEILGVLNSFDELNRMCDNQFEALVKCRNKFEFYELHHLAKGDTEKAAKNAEMIAMIRNTLTGK